MQRIAFDFSLISPVKEKRKAGMKVEVVSIFLIKTWKGIIAYICLSVDTVDEL